MVECLCSISFFSLTASTASLSSCKKGRELAVQAPVPPGPERWGALLGVPGCPPARRAPLPWQPTCQIPDLRLGRACPLPAAAPRSWLPRIAKVPGTCGGAGAAQGPAGEKDDSCRLSRSRASCPASPSHGRSSSSGGGGEPCSTARGESMKASSVPGRETQPPTAVVT